ncbi:hypothetical protein Sjap_004276 [Stephania japonica]|uniref:PHD-type zinc finger plants domain-containing protein n=1 Tax=Stephania japonica TaxID=461633 RepID=A0AAP0K201_9MAGN
MVDLHTVCCMCGDIGFPDKLFRCAKCHHRFQHSYCSNYYDESSSTGNGGFCDWCLCELRSPSSTAKHGVSLSSRRSSGREALAVMNRTSSPTSDKDHQLESNEKAGKSSTSSSACTTANTNTNTGAPSPRPSNRRYKFLKDVMC